MSPYFIHTSNLATANRLLHKKSTSILILNPFTPTYFYIRHHICIPTYKLRPYTSLCLQPMLTFHPVLYIHLCTCFYTCTTHIHSLSLHNLHNLSIGPPYFPIPVLRKLYFQPVKYHAYCPQPLIIWFLPTTYSDLMYIKTLHISSCHVKQH